MCNNTTGSHNNAFGNNSLRYLATGSDNIAIGRNSGSEFTSDEHDNVCISNIGVIGEFGIIRIGTNGTHSKTYLAGDANIGGDIFANDADFNEIAASSVGAEIIQVSVKSRLANITTNYVEKSADYTVSTTDSTLVSTNATGFITLTLPSAATAGQGRVYIFKRNGAGSLVVSAVTSQTIDIASQSFTVTSQYGYVTVQSDGVSNWVVIG
jgi:hypothetical protein